MPYIPPSVVAEAKKTDLLTYLRAREPDKLVHLGGDVWCTTEHDSLKISNGKWCWWSRQIGGRSALDYLIKVEGLPFQEAVGRIAGDGACTPPPAQSPPPARSALQIPPADADNDAVLRYLESRCIDAEILRFCIDSGFLYQTAMHQNAAFVGFDGGGVPRLIDLRATDGTDFKCAALGSDRHFPFRLYAARDSPEVHVFEGSVDALSYATLLRRAGRDWRQYDLLSLCGVYRTKAAEVPRLPVALGQYLTDSPNTETVVLHLDNDLPGRLAAQSIAAALPEKIRCLDRPPPCGKDVNEYLCSSEKEQKSKSERSIER